MMIIAVGKKCTDKSWKNTKITWDELVARLSTPKKTPETLKKYLEMTKPEQDRIKDIGGFVGGSTKDGRRNKDSIITRDLLCWDMDDCRIGDIDNILKPLDDIGTSYIIHSTHKSSELNKRYRVIIPLLETMSTQNSEYEFLMEKLTIIFGWDRLTDPITFQKNRLVFWPSIPHDQEYELYVGTGLPLDTTPFLKDYGFETVENEPKIKWKKDNGQDKSGPIGAFCRTYSVPETLDAFLFDVYEKSERKNRYTYIAGEGASGLEIKDDGSLCQSYHGTDKARCYKDSDKPRQCNSFDLIMIHKFGDDQEKAAECVAWCMDQEGVKEDGRFKKEQTGPQWDRKHVSVNKNGDFVPKLSKSNLEILFDHNCLAIKFNELSQKIVRDGKEWMDCDIGYIKDLCQECGFRGMGIGYLLTHIEQIARDNSYHPVKIYLEGLKWDGINRVDTILSEYFDAEDTEYTRAVIRKVLCGAVKRVYVPGCEMQHCIVLQGPQNIGKSSFWDLLAGEWFSDDLQLTDMGPRIGTEKLQGNWIIEIPELAGMRRAEEEAVKAFITRRIDKCRLAYARSTSNLPRQSILVGTTNSDGFLRDITGNRRYWPVRVTKRLKDNLDRDQIWAEVFSIWQNEEIKLPGHLYAYAQEMANSFIAVDNRFEMVEKFLDTPVPIPEIWENWPVEQRVGFLHPINIPGVSDTTPTFAKDKLAMRKYISVQEIWVECFGEKLEKLERRHSNEIVKYLIKMGWLQEGQRRDIYYGKPRIRYRPE